MKKIIILSALFLGCCIVTSYTQDFEYSYDAAGNRTFRQEISLLKSAKLDSLNQIDIFNEETGELAEDFTPETEYKEILGEQKITIFPNPTRGEMVVQIANLQQDNPGNIILYDLEGKVIVNLSNVNEYSCIDITSKPDGIYIMKIIINGKTSQWKVVKE